MEKADLEKNFERRFTDTGENWKSLCPFHDEKTPSFLVHKTELIAHCFGCGMGGSIDRLLSLYKGIPVERARELLDVTIIDSLNKAKARKIREFSKPRYFPESWLAPWKKEIHQYVLDRGLEVGVLSKTETRWDPHLQRQVFPHYDRDGHLLGATGRSCIGGDPKWYYYWGRRGHALYRPFEIDPLRPCILVEGVFDLLWLYQNGVGNVAATFGSRTTREHVRELRSLSEDIILGLDNDLAGHKGAEDAFKQLRTSARVRFLKWPKGVHDWMDLSKEQIHEVLGSSQTYVQRAIVRHTDTSSRDALQQTQSSAHVGAGNRENGN